MVEEAKDTRAADYMELLNYSVVQNTPSLNMLSSMQDSYDNRIDESLWPCQSQIPTGQSFVAVEEALPSALDMCFPESNGLQLIPTDDDVEDDQVRNAEWALWTMINYRMRLRDSAFKSLKDVFKLTIGYGIVETFDFTPDQVAEIVVGSKSTKIMTTGAPQRSIRYRYISPGKIIPYPTGTDFNGPDATPLAFFMDSIPRWQLEKMIEQDKLNNDGKTRFSASWADIDAAAEKFYAMGVTDFITYADKLGGKEGQHDIRRDSLPDTAPKAIPVIKIYEKPGKETWIIPTSSKEGIVLMQQAAEGLVRMRTPLVKWTAWPDGDRWYPTSAPEIDQKRGFAYDLYINFLFDMMSRTKDARLVVDKSALGPDQRHLDLTGDIYIERGNAKEAAAYLENPRIDPNILSVGGELKALGQKIQGNRDFTEKNFTRGGTQAFSELLGTMQARQRLSAIILESGALTQIYQHVLALMQDKVAEGDITLARRMYDGASGTKQIERKVITQEDLMHGFELVIDTSERRMLGGMPDGMRLAIWEKLQGRDDTRPEEVNRILPLPEATLHRLFKSREDLEALQAENREVNQLSQLAGVAGRVGPPQAGSAPAAIEGVN